jgi:hypothetical protein
MRVIRLPDVASTRENPRPFWLHSKLCVLGLLGLMLTLSSCSTVTTRMGNVDTKGAVSGMFYHLPQGRLRIKGDYADAKNPQGDFVITISTIYSASETRYFLQHKTNPFYDDDFKFQVNSKQLLETVNVVAEDKTADVLGDLAGIAAGAMKFSAGLLPSDFQPAVADAPPVRLPFDYTFKIQELDEINRKLQDKGFAIDPINANAITGAQFGTYKFTETKKKNVSSITPADGVVFRPVLPYDITITDLPYAKKLKREVEIIRATSTVFLPDESKQLLLSVQRSPFIKRTDNLVFSDGILTKLEGTRPSPVVGFLQIPKKILTAIVPLPLEIRQTQVNNIKAQRELDSLLAPKPAL